MRYNCHCHDFHDKHCCDYYFSSPHKNQSDAAQIMQLVVALELVTEVLLRQVGEQLCGEIHV
jgi:hypothetical protein